MHLYRKSILCLVCLASFSNSLHALAKENSPSLNDVIGRVSRLDAELTSKDGLAQLISSANAAFNSERYPQALKLFDEAMARVNEKNVDEKDVSPELISLVMGRAATLLKLAKYADATASYEAVIADMPNVTGIAGRKLIALNALAEIKIAEGAYADAQKYIDQATDFAKKEGLKNQDSILTQMRQADLFLALTKYPECKNSYSAAFEKSIAFGAAGKRPAVEAMIGLTIVNNFLLDYLVALDQSGKAVTMARDTFGAESMECAAAMRARANVVWRTNYDEATDLFFQAERIQVKLLGREPHPVHVYTMLALSSFYLNPPSVADGLCISAKSMANTCFSSDSNPLQLAYLKAYGYVLASQRRFKPALKYYNDALSLQQKLTGPKSVGVAQILNSMAMAYNGENVIAKWSNHESAVKVAIARATLQESVAIFKERLGPDSPRLALVRTSECLFLSNAKDFSASAKLGEELLPKLSKVLPPDSDVMISVYRQLLSDYTKAGNEEGAAKAGASLLDILLGKNGLCDPDVARTLSGLSKARPELLNVILHLPANVAGLTSTMDAIRDSLAEQPGVQPSNTKLARANTSLFADERRYGADSPMIWISLSHRAEILSEMKDYDAALATYQRLLTIQENGLGDDHPALIKTLCDYSALLTKMGKEAEAQAAEARCNKIEEANRKVEN